MKSMKTVIVILSVLFIFSACSKDEHKQNTAINSGPSGAPVSGSQAAPQQKGKISASYPPIAAQQLIQQRQDLLVVDVRTPQELKEGRIEGSVLVDFWDIMQRKHQLPRNRPLLLVCAVGGRSYAAMQVLSQQGYPEIYNLKGGIYDWKKAGLPLVYQ